MRPALVAVVLLAAHFAPAAHAAESYDNCTGTIAALPATLSTQGTWCLKADLSTALNAGNAITVAANNVTIDCNGFKLGNLNAGTLTQTIGIRAVDRSNLTVRGCALRGFGRGMDLTGGGHVIEDNRFEDSRRGAIRMTGGGSAIIRRNAIFDTGGQSVVVAGIYADGPVEVRDNLIDTVFPATGEGSTSIVGIDGAGASHQTIRGNVIRGLTSLGESGVPLGIRLGSGGGDVIDNAIQTIPAGAPAGYAIVCFGNDGFIRDNRVMGYATITNGCQAGTGNELQN